MFRLAVLLSAVVLAVLATPQHNTHHTHHHSHTTNTHHRGAKLSGVDRDEPVIPQEYVDAHSAFTLDVLKNTIFAQTVEKYGAVSVSPFSLGHFLALVNEKTFNVPTTNIPKVLHLTPEKVTDAYATILEAYEDVSEIFKHFALSNLYFYFYLLTKILIIFLLLFGRTTRLTILQSCTDPMRMLLSPTDSTNLVSINKSFSWPLKLLR